MASSQHPETNVPAPVQTALRHMTPATVLAALASVRSGQVISLNHRLDGPTPMTRPKSRRTLRLHNVLRAAADDRYVVLNDDIVEISMQGSSQWDSFAHCGVIAPGRPGVFLGGAPLEETASGGAETLGIGAMGPGVVTRGVLLDVVSVMRPGESVIRIDDRIDRTVIEATLARQQISLQPGDAVVIYTGFATRIDPNDEHIPRESGGLDVDTMPLWEEAQISALISDNPGIEVTPADFRVHIAALAELGIPLGELWALDELAVAIRDRGAADFLLVSVPLNLPYAFGSPANAVAIL